MIGDFFTRGRGNAATGLLLAIVPGTIAIAAALAARHRRQMSVASGTAEPEPTELDYHPSAEAFPYTFLQPCCA